MNIRQYCLGLFLLLIASFAQAQTPSQNLSTLLNNVRTMKANFVQVVYDNKGKEAQRSYGQMAMQRPGKFRWNVTKPIPQLIIANGTKLWIYDADLEQVTIRALKKAAGESPALLLSNVDNTLDNVYVVKELPVSNGLQWFELTPRNADNMFAGVELGFANNQIQEMKLKDHLGHTTQVKFTNIVNNSSIPENTFVFNAPKNVDVIDETHKG